MNDVTMRVLGPEELKQVGKLTLYLDKLTVLDLSIEVHDQDGVKLGEIRQHEDWGYVFFAEQGGEIERKEEGKTS